MLFCINTWWLRSGLTPQSSRQFASLLSGRQQLFLYERNFVASSFPCYSTKKMSSTSPNKLIESKSPYLLQHAHNPVDWYPWGQHAFQKAKEEKKLIFLSIGYSTCHWCHVMEKESFENMKIASLMNQHFINVKVDREERPDVDKMYMNFVQAISGSGGWPMSVWLTPDLHPIYGGTYYPPNDRYYGQPGFGTILNSLAQQWKEDPEKFSRSGEKILAVLTDSSALKDTGDDLPSALACGSRCFQQLQSSYEPDYGGFNKAPKFPQPSNLRFLLRLHAQGHPESDTAVQALEMCLNTLKHMAKGGIHDHVLKGFARYSTDQKWHVPHFEKMLYDQAQLISTYVEAYLVTGEDWLAQVVRDIVTYTENCLSDPSGGFYSAEDADSYPDSNSSSKKEGAFCVWSMQEIQSLLGKIPAGLDNGVTLADVVCHHYDVRANGNVDPFQDPHDELKGKNVLIVRGSEQETADKFGLVGDVETLRSLLKSALAILKEARDKRPPPHLDDKMLAAWNGLMISALAKAGAVLNEPSYVERAVKASHFIRQHLFDAQKKRLIRSCYRGVDHPPVQNAVPIEGFLDDYAFVIDGLLDLFTATQDSHWLQWADELQRTQDQLFWDTNPISGCYFTSVETDASILVRCKEDQDGAEPSGNSVAAANLMRLSTLLDCDEYRDKAGRMFRLFSQRLTKVPIALPAMVSALMLYENSPPEVLIAGAASSPVVGQMLDAVLHHRNWLLGQVVIRIDPLDERETAGFLGQRRPALRQLKAPAAYLCRHRSCSAPVATADDLCGLLAHRT